MDPFQKPPKLPDWIGNGDPRPSVTPSPPPAPPAEPAAAAAEELWFRTARWTIVAVAGLVYLVLAAGNRGLITTDFLTQYVQVARGLVAGERELALALDPLHGPVYSIALSLLMRLGLSPLAAAHAISWASGLVLIALMGALAARGWGERVAAWTVALTALSPVVLEWSVFEGIDMLQAALTAGTLSAAWLMGGAAGWLLGGLLGGLTAVTKGSGLVLILWGLVAVWFVPGGGSRLHRALLLALFVGGHFLFMIPWWLENSRLHGEGLVPGAQIVALHRWLFPPGATIEGSGVGAVFRAWPFGFTVRFVAVYWDGVRLGALVATGSHLLGWLALAALVLLLIRGKLTPWQWGFVLFFFVAWLGQAPAGFRPRRAILWAPLFLLALSALADQLPRRVPAAKIALGTLAAALAILSLGRHFHVRAEAVVHTAPARALATWFAAQPEVNGQAIHVHPHDPAIAFLDGTNAPLPVPSWYRVRGSRWRDQVPLASWMYYDPQFDQGGVSVPVLERGMPEGWAEVEVPGIAPARLFSTGPTAGERGAGEFALEGDPQIDATSRLVTVTLRNSGEVAGRAVLALQQRVTSVFHREQIVTKPFHDPLGDVTLRYEVPTVVGLIDLLRAETALVPPGETLTVRLPVPLTFPGESVQLAVNPWAEGGRGDSLVDLGTFEGEPLLAAAGETPAAAILDAEALAAVQTPLAEAASGDAAVRARAWAAVARQARAASSPALALAAAREALALDESQREALGLQGIAAQDLHNQTRIMPLRGEAEAAFRRLFERDPRQVWAALRVAGFQSADGRWAEMIALLAPISGQDGVPPELFYRLAEAYDHAGATSSAAQHYRRFIERLRAAGQSDRREGAARTRLAELGTVPSGASGEAMNLP